MSLNNPVPDWTSCQTRPTLSPAKAYAICGRLKRMMKNNNIANYEKIHLHLMNMSNVEKFKDRVKSILRYRLQLTNEQTKDWINEHF